MWYIVVECERMLREKERERGGNGGEREREREWREEREQFFVTFY